MLALKQFKTVRREFDSRFATLYNTDINLLIDIQARYWKGNNLEIMSYLLSVQLVVYFNIKLKI